MDNLTSKESLTILFEIDKNTVEEVAKLNRFSNVSDVIVDYISRNYEDVHDVMKPLINKESFDLSKLLVEIIEDTRSKRCYLVSYIDDDKKIKLGAVIIKMDPQTYRGTGSLPNENDNCNTPVNPFLGKVYKLRDSESSNENLEELYDSTSPSVSEYKEINMIDNAIDFSDPTSTDDIVIEGIENIDVNKYIPYPNGPLNRPPVPFDLWRLIKDRKKGE